MRLVELAANKSSFKTIPFNREGLSLIVGARTRPIDAALDKTYNGVGKSLALVLVHFCLGSNKIPAFEVNLPDWEFQLTFESAGVTHRVRRNCRQQNRLQLDDRELGVRELCEELGADLFDLPQDIGDLKCRSLLYKFLRRGRKDYMQAEGTDADRTDYARLLRNALLLGLDLPLVTEKHRLRKRCQQIDTGQKNLSHDPILRDFYAADRDVDIELAHLQERIAELEASQHAFQVAENYYEVQQEANALSAELQQLKNRSLVLKNAINNIDRSLRVRPDVSPDQLAAAYGEFQAAFKPETLRRLDEVHAFQRQLLDKRMSRLTQDRRRLGQEQRDKERTIRELNEELDRKLAYLGSSRALDYFVTIGNEISEHRARVRKLQDYRELQRRWSDELAQVKADMQQEVIRANQYLDQNRETLEHINGVFKRLSRRLYPHAPAGIRLHNNEGDNQLRFDFEVRIENDASDGINEARIFCYDLTLLLAGRNHRMNTLFHDSRLFSDMDPRQRAELFRIARDETSDGGRQYIATLNQDQVDGMEPYLAEGERESLIERNVVLRLGDEAPEDKLLGIQVDMHYE